MASLIDRLRGMWGGGPGTGIGVFYLGGGHGTFLGQSWDFTRISNTVYTNPTGYRCVQAIESNFSRPSWQILPTDTPWPVVTGEAGALKDHPLLEVLNHPTPGESATMFQRSIARDLELSGRHFRVKMQGVDGYGNKGPVTGLRRLPPQRVTVVGNQDDELLGFVYTDRQGRQFPALPDSMVYLRYPHPERVYDGQAPALIAGLPSETDTASARFNRDLLQNDGALPGYMVIEGLTPDQFQAWKLEWEAGQVPGKTRFIGAAQASYQKVGQTNQELTYNELRQDSQDDIMRAFGVPRAVAFDVSHETYANAEREQSIFMQHNILPKWVLVCDELTLQLGVSAAQPVRIALDLTGIDELQDSRDKVVERAVKLTGIKAMTINEFRRTQGWPDVAWGDEPQAPLQQMSAIPLAPGGNEPAIEAPQLPEPKVVETAPTNGHDKQAASLVVASNEAVFRALQASQTDHRETLATLREVAASQRDYPPQTVEHHVHIDAGAIQLEHHSHIDPGAVQISSPVTIAEGAVQHTIADGAIQLEHHSHIDEGAVQVSSPVTIAEGAIQSTHTIDPGAVQVSAPVTIEKGAVQASHSIEKGAIQAHHSIDAGAIQIQPAGKRTTKITKNSKGDLTAQTEEE